MPGSYILQASLKVKINQIRDFETTVGRSSYSTSFVRKITVSALAFYGDGTPYINQAASFTLRGDEERASQNMTLPISKLHKLTGRVVAQADGHVINAATVELISTNSKKPIASTVIDTLDSLFHFEFVPEGDFTLRITHPRDVAGPAESLPIPGSVGGDSPLENERVLKTYGNVDMPRILRGDMTGITATVPAKQTNPTAASN